MMAKRPIITWIKFLMYDSMSINVYLWQEIFLTCCNENCSTYFYHSLKGCVGYILKIVIHTYIYQDWYRTATNDPECLPVHSKTTKPGEMFEQNFSVLSTIKALFLLLIFCMHNTAWCHSVFWLWTVQGQGSK
jgi:hypothetical protein